MSCGEAISLTPRSDDDLNSAVVAAAVERDFDVLVGNTISTDDYYEAQARMDGAFCDFDRAKRMEYLTHAHDQHGVRNFEMEATLFLSFCHRAQVSAAVVYVTYLDRLKGDRNNDQIPDDMDSFEERPLDTILQYIINDTK